MRQKPMRPKGLCWTSSCDSPRLTLNSRQQAAAALYGASMTLDAAAVGCVPAASGPWVGPATPPDAKSPGYRRTRPTISKPGASADLRAAEFYRLKLGLRRCFIRADAPLCGDRMAGARSTREVSLPGAARFLHVLLELGRAYC